MTSLNVRLHSGLGDGFLHMYTRLEHLCLEAIKEKYPECFITIDVVSNNKDLTELYKHNPLIGNITLKNQSEFIKQGLPVEQKYGVSFEGYRKTLPNFYLDKDEQHLVNELQKESYVFLHLYSSTPRKKIVSHMPVVEIVDYLIDTLGVSVVYFGKSHEFDAHSHARGYPSCEEVFSYTRRGLHNFTAGELFKFNNPRVAWHLLKEAQWALLAESAYLQPATYLDKKIFTIIGPGMMPEYLRDIDNEYFAAFKKKSNVFVEAKDVTKERLKEFHNARPSFISN